MGPMKPFVKKVKNYPFKPIHVWIAPKDTLEHSTIVACPYATAVPRVRISMQKVKSIV